MPTLRMKTIAGFFLITILAVPLWGDTSNASPPVPGTLNYVEGKVSIGTEALDSKSIGSAELRAGQSLTTGVGMAEILLTPGVFLRVGNNSSVRMISSGLIDTEVGIEKGHAMIEVSEIHPENEIRVVAGGATTSLLKTGLYDFDLDQGQLRVFDGKAAEGDAGKPVTVNAGREINLTANGPLKATKFNKKTDDEDDLYRWSSLRSAYLAEANVDAAALYTDNGYGPWGYGWMGSDWYWDPWFDAFTFIPGDGIFYSPFGWGFYSPWCVNQSPFYGHGFGRGFGPIRHHFSTNYHDWGGNSHYVGGTSYDHGVYRGPGSTGGGFHSGPRMGIGTRGFGGFGGSRGGGFGGGGFHGGGFHGGVGVHGGGGFHGR
jgi:hypothetical protein